MKKLLVIALAVVLTLSLAVVASAATFAGSVGGEYQITYSSDVNKNSPILSFEGDQFGARFKSYVVGTVEDKDTNTWAKIGCLISTWNLSQTHTATTEWTDADTDTVIDAGELATTVDGSNVAAPVFEAGIKQIGGSKVDVWYTNDENGNTKRGQIPLNQQWFKFGGDPGFSNGVGNVLGVDYNGDNANVNFIYGLNKGTNPDNLTIAAGTLKFDGGNVWAGYRMNADTSSQMGVGAEAKLGFGTLKVDYITNAPVDGSTADDASYLQANINFEALKLDVTFLYDQKVVFPGDGGMGIGLVYNFTDKLSVGAKTITANDDAKETTTWSDYTNYYLGYNFGIFETRIGSATYTFAGTSVDAFYATAHVGMW